MASLGLSQIRKRLRIPSPHVILENYFAKTNRIAQCAEFTFIFSHYRIVIIGMMQIITDRDYFETEFFKFFQRKIKQGPVIRLETQMSALAQ